MKMVFMLGFFTVIFTFMLTLYRLLQRLFRKEIEVAGRQIDFDERRLVRVAGFYWFIPFGLTLQVASFSADTSDPHFGKVMVIQGLAMAMATWLSKLIKK